MAPTLNPPKTSHGYVSDSLGYDSTYLDALEHVPDLLPGLAVRTYGLMRRDAQLAAILAGYTLQLRRASWQLDPRGCRPEVVQLVADDMGIPVAGEDQHGGARTTGMSWNEHLRSALTMLAFGHSAFALQADITSGQARLAGVWERPQWTISNIHVDGKTGALTGVTQDAVYKESAPQIRADELVWYALDREGANWAGTSLLRPAYAPWLIKQEMQRVLAISNRRFGMGVPTVEWAPGTNPTPAQHAAAMQVATAARVGDQAGAALPPGAHLVLAGLTGGTPDTLQFLKWLDQQMSRQALMGHIDLGETSNGSRALGTTFVDVLMMALESIGEHIADVATRQIAARLVAWNWGPDEAVPRVTVSGIGSKREVTAESLQLLLSSGGLSADPALEAWIRREYRLPERTAGAPTVETPAPVVPPTPPPVQVAAQARNRRRPRTTEGQLPLPVMAAAPDYEAMQAEYDQAVAELTSQWEAGSSVLVAALVSAVIAEVAASNIGALGSLVVPDGTLTALTATVAAGLLSVAATSAAAAAVEVGVTAPDLDDAATARIEQTAQATVRLIAAGYTSGAARSALTQAGPGVPAETVGDAVRTHLDDLSAAKTSGLVAGNLAAAVSTAQAEGRRVAFAEAPAGTRWKSSEELDKNTCTACLEVRGREYPTLTEALVDYPVAGFVGCEGGHRCRGQIIPIP